MHWRKKN